MDLAFDDMCLDRHDPAFIGRGSHSSLRKNERKTKGEIVIGGGNRDRRHVEGFTIHYRTCSLSNVSVLLHK